MVVAGVLHLDWRSRHIAVTLQSCCSRGDKTAMELFLAGVQGWEAGLRRQMDDGNAAVE